MKNTFSRFLLLPAAVLGSLSLFALTTETAVAPDADNAGLKLPAGFGALKVAETGGRARHITVTPQGTIYVKLNRPNAAGKGILVLHETSGGKAEVASGFGNYGGTGILSTPEYLYASSDEEVFRYKLNGKGEVINPDQPEKIITGLVNRKQHESKSITLDKAGNIYVNVGAYSNSCQVKDRQKGSMGIENCPVLDSAGGIWQFKADKLNQTYGSGIRYATGLRNVVGLDWNTQANQLFVMQHGRDQLYDNFPSLYTSKQSAELPAECMYALNRGDNAGWPYIYYDNQQHKKMVAPEYGGDGKKVSTGNYLEPAAAYPAHTAPDALLFYTGTMFPEKYRNGAFIAFHGSWNRAPEPQKGYYVVFQPFKNGKPSGDWEVFADNFAGSEANAAAGRPEHKPCGLAQGPDGSLYVTDDKKGTIYRIVYTKK
ncbi:sorbosone dehydrogenase [Hymenobacter taeanensis]|uniref:Sorbosone dehydrogenase n=1 Tax=Hymenobacter taeanensis TaxID=2735321 RepID=A0A6M6BLG8_9BACT|nr:MULTISPECIES: PQQ-dependent sugar dehydrogenase [Hymenobacter]QJX48976.1 sorbosone dehydrogenase [Hymenobacter taeanensis]UOQ81507.1 PQQ-dependent sugar dehydrogenase [Hymenobacter sp. 5414T-23]